MTTPPAARPAEPRFCKDCRHMRDGIVAVCTRPTPPRFDLVHGRELQTLYLACHDERLGGEAFCGPSARFFEPIPEAPR